MRNIEVVNADITKIPVDAIVNPANPRLLGGGGVDGAIHTAGGPEIRTACAHLRETTLPNGLEPGCVVSTTAGDLPAKWVIHTVGPIYGTPDAGRILRDCYWRSLREADWLGAESIAFPLIGGGSYGWPISEAVEFALAGISFGPQSVFKKIYLVAFNEATAEEMRKQLPWVLARAEQKD